ncbi:DUF4352 domain-containing protein [Thermobrachium celere]|uniref:DUF5067 domain-containing protein n=1 Tax=Thermobrachium celere DSM 8682 TaxID=941824 RepID=R7RT60_9CLOT|nr:DUF5067 domain-containing protein [Thermobrachium celere]GFR34568.1 hypothetical protein TCEA9_03800 [Thermobrachium celere]CDF58440.1 hypothetical protein TCEL_00486 [Thermobrachium celere DSM 8682]
MKRIMSLILLSLLSITLISCEPTSTVDSKPSANTPTAQQTNNNSSEQKQEEKQEEKIFKLGETVIVDNKYEFTINKVYLTKKRNEFADKQYKKVAIIEYSFKNTNSDEDVLVSDMNFKVYDESGNILDTYPVVDISDYPNAIAKGKQAKGAVAYGFNEGSKLELHFYPNIFDNKSSAKFILDVK